MVITLADSEKEAAWRDEVREFIKTQTPAALRAATDEGEGSLFGRMGAIKEWREKLADKGWIAPSWPKKYGGADMTVAEQFIMNEEFAENGVPGNVGGFGVMMIGPTIIEHGTEEQKEEHLTKILKGEIIWCQGYSEPGAGSDLASLQTRAIRDGDDYVINGQKIWTTGAQYADMMYMLVRTDPDAPKHRGISWVIVPMDTPGIDVRPLETIRGSREFSEVYFDDVRVPVANRVGDENDGWRVAMVTFSFERGTAFVSELLFSMQLVADLARIAKVVTSDGAAAWEDRGLRREIGHLAAEFDALWALTRRNISQAARDGVPGVGGSVFKLAYSEARQKLGDLSDRVLERAALSMDDLDGLGNGRHVTGRLHALSISIAAGTTQIQRNIVGERVLGLPKER
jgi:alkylation response protein AidB-like acyl-CoA dehydrogenase